MAITSKGYTGTIGYADWALVSSYAGAEGGVVGAGALSVGIGPGDREVRVQLGRAVGQGIIDDSDAVGSLVAAPVSSGNRWDLIALRRNWLTGLSTLVLITGTADKAVPVASPDFENEPGVICDQPLSLVRFAAGQTAAQEFEDVRVWYGSGGAAARSLLVRDFLTRIGTRIWIQGVTWVLGFAPDGSPRWVPDSPYVGSTMPPYAEGLVWIKTP